MKCKLLPLLLVSLLAGLFANAQTIPVGSCGIQYTYDASGNTLSKQYVCANARMNVPAGTSAEQYARLKSTSIQKADALYTQPQSGLLSLLFLKPLKENRATITNEGGKEIMSYTLTGSNIQFNLSKMPKGRYYLKMLDGDIRINQAIVKL